MSHPWLRLRGFAGADDGQDLVEYAFLAVFIALASIGVFLVLQTTIGTAYTATTTNVNGLWEPADPS